MNIQNDKMDFTKEIKQLHKKMMFTITITLVGLALLIGFVTGEYIKINANNAHALKQVNSGHNFKLDIEKYLNGEPVKQDD